MAIMLYKEIMQVNNIADIVIGLTNAPPCIIILMKKKYEAEKAVNHQTGSNCMIKAITAIVVNNFFSFRLAGIELKSIKILLYLYYTLIYSSCNISSSRARFVRLKYYFIRMQYCGGSGASKNQKI